MLNKIKVNKFFSNINYKSNINMTVINNIINNLSSSVYKPIQLGRWSLEYDSQKIEERVKWANEDNSF